MSKISTTLCRPCAHTSILARFIEPRSIRTGLSSSSRSTFVGLRSLSNQNRQTAVSCNIWRSILSTHCYHYQLWTFSHKYLINTGHMCPMQMFVVCVCRRRQITCVQSLFHACSWVQSRCHARFAKSVFQALCSPCLLASPEQTKGCLSAHTNTSAYQNHIIYMDVILDKHPKINLLSYKAEVTRLHSCLHDQQTCEQPGSRC